ncbi:MAG TPA: Fic family protein [Bacteroidia bacterium]|nr:Fic family protein [Bacteroidia bacterium]
MEYLKNELRWYLPLKDSVEKELWDKIRIDWNFHSSNMEGVQFSFEETQKLVLKRGEISGKRIRDCNQVNGHDAAIAEIRALVQEKRPLTEHFIRGLHEILLKEPYYNPAKTLNGEPTEKLITIGEYKKLPNDVETKKGMFAFATPEDTPILMGELVQWCNEQLEKLECHAVLIASELHYRFVRIHPFDDGNGRMARLLTNYILMRLGYPPAIIRTEQKQEYLAALREGDKYKKKKNLNPLSIFIGQRLIDGYEIYFDAAKNGIQHSKGDLEKRILLLTKKLENQYMKTARTNQIMAQTIQTVYAPLVWETDKRIQKLAHLFTENHWCYFQEPQPPKYGYPTMPNSWSLLNILKHFYALANEKGSSAHQFKVMNWMTSFRSKEKKVDLEVAFKIYFYDFEYEIMAYVGMPYESSMLMRGLKNIFSTISKSQGFEDDDKFSGFDYSICRIEYGSVPVKEDIIKWAEELGHKVVSYIENKAKLNPHDKIDEKPSKKFFIPKSLE